MVSSITALQGLYVALGGELSDVANITTIPDMLEAISTVASAAASELPPVKDTDNGKVLTVVNAKWAKADLPGDELPAVTSDDNGKVLMVVDGEWGLGSITRTYTVSYNLNGGSGAAPQAQEVEAGGSITTAAKPQPLTPPAGKLGFLGWDTDPNQQYPARVPAGSSYTPERDTVLYAIYEQEI